MEKDSLSQKMKKLKHVKVYDMLYAMIQEGVYPPNSQLPSEPELSATMNVSRMTLRKSLALLIEDNLIINIRGKGNFVSCHSVDTFMLGMEHTIHPMYNCFCGTINDLELEFRIEASTNSINHMLQRDVSVAVIVDRWYKKDNDVLSYSLSFIPTEVIDKKKINLNNKNELQTFLEDTLYINNTNSSCVISYTTTGNFTSTKYKLSNTDAFVLIQETIYDNDEIIVFTKHYIPVTSFKMKINTMPKGI